MQTTAAKDQWQFNYSDFCTRAGTYGFALIAIFSEYVAVKAHSWQELHLADLLLKREVV